MTQFLILSPPEEIFLKSLNGSESSRFHISHTKLSFPWDCSIRTRSGRRSLKKPRNETLKVNIRQWKFHRNELRNKFLRLIEQANDGRRTQRKHRSTHTQAVEQNWQQRKKISSCFFSSVMKFYLLIYSSALCLILFPQMKIPFSFQTIFHFFLFSFNFFFVITNVNRD